MLQGQHPHRSDARTGPQRQPEPGLQLRNHARSFGFSGHPTPRSAPHKYCPSISDNCCTAEDAEASFTIWNTDTRFKIERYYQIFNYAIRYLFGFTPEGFLLGAEPPRWSCCWSASGRRTTTWR